MGFFTLMPIARDGHSGRSIHPAGRKEQRKEGHRRAIRTSRANGASCREGIYSIVFSSARRLNLSPRVPLKNTQPMEFGERGLFPIARENQCRHPRVVVGGGAV